MDVSSSIRKTGRTYHTRYVTPEVFKNALRTRCDPSEPAQSDRLNENDRQPVARIIVAVFFVATAGYAAGHQAHIGAARRQTAQAAELRRPHWPVTDFICKKFRTQRESTSFIRRRRSIRSSSPSCPKSRRWALQSRSWISIVTAGPISM